MLEFDLQETLLEYREKKMEATNATSNRNPFPKRAQQE